MGRTCAVEALMRGHEVELFDPGLPDCPASCGQTGAGMLAPYSELETSDPIVFELGQDAVARWLRIVKFLGEPVFIQEMGTLVIAHSQDEACRQDFVRHLSAKFKQLGLNTDILKSLSKSDMDCLEPALSGRFTNGLFLPEEGQIDNRQLMRAMSNKLSHCCVNEESCEEVVETGAGYLRTRSRRLAFDLILDCRGLMAKDSFKALRGVRGELIEVSAPEVHLRRPVRLMHPRYSLYVVPRENDRYLIGATSIESEDFRPITVQSMLELLSAAFSLEPAFAEASIIEARVNCRPSLPDNLPSIVITERLIKINGLYRHGFLLAPKLASLTLDVIEGKKPERDFAGLFQQGGLSVVGAC